MLFQSFLKSARFGYPDTVRDMIHGCRITEDMGRSGIFPTKLKGEVHEDFREGRALRGKCVDLASAYRQLAVSPIVAAILSLRFGTPIGAAGCSTKRGQCLSARPLP